MTLRALPIGIAAVIALCAAAPPAPSRNTGPVLARELILTAGTPGSALNYRWVAPVEAGLYPALARSLRTAAERQLADDRDEAAELAKLGGASARVSRDTRWQTAADTPRLLSIWSTEWAYTGGAHGNTSHDVVLWDKQRQRRVALGNMLVDPKRGFAALTPAFCRALDQERARRRSGARIEGDFATTCPDLATQPIVPVAVGDGGQIWRLSVKLAPGEAGPYAEGGYDIDLPVPAAFVAALRPEWRSAFRATAD